jgi:hypothetical protein
MNIKKLILWSCLFLIGHSVFAQKLKQGHNNISQPEHRPWQQVQWHTNYQKIRIMHLTKIDFF